MDKLVARIVAEAGYPVIATLARIASSLLSWTARLLAEDMLSTVRRIADRIELPVTADMETGYGEAPEAVALMLQQRLLRELLVQILRILPQRVGHTMLDYDLSVARIRAGREAGK